MLVCLLCQIKTNKKHNTMKYPLQQLESLENVLNTLHSIGVDFSQAHPSTIHFFAYQQLSSGQVHNSIVLVDDKPMLRHAAISMGLDFKEVFKIDDTFKLYPDGCNDSHVETAIKNVLKRIYQ